MAPVKVVILGIDALNFNVLDPLISDGTLPNFRKLKERSAYSTMNSIIPSVTGPAWTTINTGKNPGKHGIFDFVRIEDGRSKVNTRADIDGEFFTDTLSRFGKKCIVMSVPFTYPPGKWYKGVAVSDFLYTKVEISDGGLSHLMDGYRVVPNDRLRGPDLAADMHTITRRQIQLCKNLLSGVEWDIAFFYFGMLDSFSHKFFDKIGKDTPEWEHGKAILRAFDDLVGYLHDGLAEDDYLFVISDHGFRRYSHTVYLNRILESEGYLLRTYSLDRGKTGSSKGLKSSIGKVIKLPVIYQIARFFYRTVGSLLRRSGKDIRIGLDEGIDYVNSSAFTPTTESLGIMINPSVMKSTRSKETLLQLLGSLEHEGERVFTKIVPREDIYNGDHVHLSPDYLLFSSDFMVDANIRGKELFGGQYLYHDFDAVLFIAGKGIKTGPMDERPDLQDIAPTVLRLFGIAKSQDMDGRFLESAFFEPPPAGSAELDRIKKAALKFKGKGPQSR